MKRQKKLLLVAPIDTTAVNNSKTIIYSTLNINN